MLFRSDLVQFFAEEEFIGINEVVACFFVFCDDFFEAQWGIGSVGFLTFGEGAIGVKVVIGIDLTEFQVAVKFGDFKNPRIAILTAVQAGRNHTIFCVGKVNKFRIELIGIDHQI